MISLRATVTLSGAIALTLTAAPAQAQMSDDIVLNIMRECAKVEDASSRLACYDNNIRANGGGNSPASPDDFGRIRGGQAPISTVEGNARSVTGFGAEDVRVAERFESRAGDVDEINARVTNTRERQPGVYRITLENGAEWQFTESVGDSYRMPRRGDTLEIRRGSIGSFLMFFDGQTPVRLRRVK